MSQWLPIDQIADNVRSGKTKATDLVEQALSSIKKNDEYNAVISTVEDRARQRAKEIDRQEAKQKKGKLAGVPFIAKDNFLTLGGETTAASNILKGFVAPYQATAINKLESEGAICVAKANLDAFAHGSSTENSDFMITKNPHDKSLVPVGSSGGSAASVILDMVPFAIGTDTGGSIRLPAAFCGAVGYKPTYGLVSRSGVVAMASSTDVIGPLTKTVADAAIVLDVLAGKDDLDSTTIDRDEKSYADLSITSERKKVGLVKEYLSEGVDDGVRKIITDNVRKLQTKGYVIDEVSMPSLSLALACYYIIVPAEISSNLSRYDGQRFGYSSNKANTLDESYNWSRSEGFGKEAKRRIMIGTYVLSSGYYDAYYKRAQKLRTKLINEFTEAFNKYDFLIGPTAPSVAFKIGEAVNDPLKMYMQDVLTVAANLVGIPSISIPAGNVGGLPVGLQVMANQHRDRELLIISKDIEDIIK